MRLSFESGILSLIVNLTKSKQAMTAKNANGFKSNAIRKD